MFKCTVFHVLLSAFLNVTLIELSRVSTLRHFFVFRVFLLFFLQLQMFVQQSIQKFNKQTNKVANLERIKTTASEKIYSLQNKHFYTSFQFPAILCQPNLFKVFS